MSSPGLGFRRDKVLPYFLSALPNCFSVSYYFESLNFFFLFKSCLTSSVRWILFVCLFPIGSERHVRQCLHFWNKFFIKKKSFMFSETASCLRPFSSNSKKAVLFCFFFPYCILWKYFIVKGKSQFNTRLYWLAISSWTFMLIKLRTRREFPVLLQLQTLGNWWRVPYLPTSVSLCPSWGCYHPLYVTSASSFLLFLFSQCCVCQICLGSLIVFWVA